VSEISLSWTFYRCLILYLTFISSCVLFDSYVLLADDHVNNVSYFPFMAIKKVIPYFCVLREGYYVIIWLIDRICVFIKDWKLIYSELFITPSPTKLRRDIVTRLSVSLSHPCEHSRINILQWILTKLGTYLVLKRIWNPIDFQGQGQILPHNILVNTLESTFFNGFWLNLVHT
jgi:hypothetical protein